MGPLRFPEGMYQSSDVRRDRFTARRSVRVAASADGDSDAQRDETYDGTVQLVVLCE